MIIIKRSTIMSDRFCDKRTYSKRSTEPAKTEARKAYTRINNSYLAYATVVKVNDINDDFKRLVDDFKECFALSASARPTGLIKQQWVNYYNDHH